MQAQHDAQVFIFGMSHMIGLMKAISTAPQALTLDNWDSSAATEFEPAPVRPGLFPGDQVASLVISAQGWGGIADIMLGADGKREVRGAEGFVKLLGGLQPIQQGRTLVSVLHGSSHSALSLVRHPQPFDFFLSGHEHLPFIANAQPLPEAVVRRQLEPYLVSTIASLAIARLLLPSIRLVHMFAPPPITSEEQIRRVPEGFRAHMDAYGITPLSLRLKYYLLANRIVREGVAGLGVAIDFLDAPPEALDEQGGLLERYASGATHANEQYGELMAQQLHRLINS
jgi:hypothetical protein